MSTSEVEARLTREVVHACETGRYKVGPFDFTLLTDKQAQIDAARAIHEWSHIKSPQKQEKAEREYVAQIATLQVKISNLQSQISEADKRYESLKKQTLRMYHALQESSISIDIDPEFRDTLERMKALK